MELGRLEEVDIREVWRHEQYDFSAWLAKEENICELSKILGAELSVINTEQFVGNFRCDIFAKDDLERNVIIENQLESTNHDHLGKLITYASGLEASVVVWIVKDAKDEHASAIQWLNQRTDENASFFLIEIHAYKIGDSKPAPYFKIIEQPNDFARNIKNITKDGELPKRKIKRLEFWEKFNEIIEKRKNPFNIRKPNTQHWYSVAIGSSRCHLSVVLLNKYGFIRIELWIPDDKELYNDLFEQKEQIEREIGYALDWHNPEDKKASSISLNIEGLDFDNSSNYNDLMNKAIDKVIEFKEVFSKYLR